MDSGAYEMGELLLAIDSIWTHMGCQLAGRELVESLLAHAESKQLQAAEREQIKAIRRAQRHAKHQRHVRRRKQWAR